MSTRPWLGTLQKMVVLLALAPLALATTAADAQNPAGGSAEASSAKPHRHPRKHAEPPAPALSGTPTEVEAVGPAASASVAMPPPPTRAGKQKRATMTDLRQVVSAPGFQMLSNGGSRVEVNVLGRPKVLQYVTSGALVYVFQNAMVPLRNNQNALVTRFFNTPVADARLRQVGHDVHLTVDLRAQATPQARIIELVPGKVLSLQVDFAPGAYFTDPIVDPARGRRTPPGPANTPSRPTRAAPPATRDSVLGPPAP